MFIGHRFLINIFLIFFSACISAESNQFDEISDIEGVFLDFNYPDKKVQMIADRTYILSDEVFELQGVSITSESVDKTLNINSSIATYDQSLNKIYMEDSVKFQTKFKDKQIVITSEKLQYDIHEENLIGYERSIVTFNDLKVISSNFSFMQSGEDIKAIFQDGKISINLSNEISTGMANKVTVFFNRNEVFLEGDATFGQDGLLIKSDFILYDISKNKIVKSLNSSIEKSI